MTSIYTHRAELGSAHEQIKKCQDAVLDIYDPKQAKLDALLIQLTDLDKELTDLEREFEALQLELS